jgi:hypothetical protein
MKSEPLNATALGAYVDYSLIKRTTLEKFKQGKVLKADICDAQSELLRVAKNYGIQLDINCPICNDRKLVSVTFAFGSKIVKSGICVTDDSEVFNLAKKSPALFLYDIEVCLGCKWNHLIKKSQVKS